MKDINTDETIGTKIEKLISEYKINNCKTILSILEIQKVYIYHIVLFSLLYYI